MTILSTWSKSTSFWKNAAVDGAEFSISAHLYQIPPHLHLPCIPFFWFTTNWKKALFATKPPRLREIHSVLRACRPLTFPSESLLMVLLPVTLPLLCFWLLSSFPIRLIVTNMFVTVFTSSPTNWPQSHHSCQPPVSHDLLSVLLSTTLPRCPLNYKHMTNTNTIQPWEQLWFFERPGRILRCHEERAPRQLIALASNLPLMTPNFAGLFEAIKYTDWEHPISIQLPQLLLHLFSALLLSRSLSQCLSLKRTARQS